MSRTDKTMPLRLQIEDGGRWFQTGGTWRGIKEWNRRYWGRQRTAERNALRSGREPVPSRPRHDSKWDMY